MTIASMQFHCITLSIITSDYFKGFSVTSGNPDIYRVLLVIAQSFLSQQCNRKIEMTSLV